MDGGGDGDDEGGGDGLVDGGGDGDAEGGGDGDAEGGGAGTTYTTSSVRRISRLSPTCFTVMCSPPSLSDQPELAAPHQSTYGSSSGLLASYDDDPHMTAPFAVFVSPAARPTHTSKSPSLARLAAVPSQLYAAT